MEQEAIYNCADTDIDIISRSYLFIYLSIYHLLRETEIDWDWLIYEELAYMILKTESELSWYAVCKLETQENQ